MLRNMGKLEAIIKGRCPRCRLGKMFNAPSYDLKRFHKMEEKCSKCHLKFEVEPGFFVGAMYVNYAFTIALIVAVSIALNIFNLYSLKNFMIGVLGFTLILLPILFRYSRILFLHIFGGVSFEGKADA